MPAREISLAPAINSWSCRALAALLILATATLHFVYLAWHCPLDLAPDEAHYWEWSRHLDWSYYSKGPLVAYLIRAGTTLAGPLSRQLTGTDMLAVRLPAIVCGSLLLASLYVLTVQVYGRERLALAVVVAALTLPPFAAGSSIMTIDAPYTCCWGWALVLGHRAMFRGSAWAWPLAGLMVGLGILAKYTMVLWLPSAGLFLLTAPERRRLLLRPGFWVMTGVAGLSCLPILIWNAQHDWVTFRHVGGLAGFHPESEGIHWLGPLAYVGTQAALLLGYWFVAWAAALTVHRPWRDLDPGRQYLWWMSVPMFVVFLVFGLKTGGGEPNWPVTAYLSGLALAIGWVAGQLHAGPVWYRRLAAVNLAGACVLGLTLTVFVHHTEWLYPLLARWAGPPREGQPTPVRHLDPTARLRGWRGLAADVDRLRARLRAEGIEAELAGSGWTIPGELAIYCQGQPTVYSFGAALGDRHSQFDWWRPNPVANPDHFAGRTFIVVGLFHPALREAFAVVEEPRAFFHYQDGHPLGFWMVTVCRGFRGFPPPADTDRRF